MAVTRLQRKDRKNKARAVNRKVIMKQRTRKPEIKRVDVEAIKQEFAAKKAGQTSQTEPSAEA
ncbi:MAG: hypothetical protein HC913_16140 [Microscillaceae bacterium]|nr:hypothetical protein [Microscillaceae bacterium]